ncbi:MAG: glutathione S-transferase [Candidatus Tokpelaia sp. JSC085]|nr:MAG: glutathione S-transferase [Candidatus Tokpelaia sp. JSC085]
MKLYFSPGACSLASHIVARELGVAIDLVKVDLARKLTYDNRDFNTINPKGYVPVLELDDGHCLTEGPAIMLHLADQYPAKGLLPACGTYERAKVHEWLAFAGMELHKNFSPFFNKSSSDAEKQTAQSKLSIRFRFLEDALATATANYLVSNCFSVADAYLYTVLSWCGDIGFDLKAFPAIQRYVAHLSKRASIMTAIQAEQSI